MSGHPEDAYLFELEYDENLDILPNEDGTWFKFTERAEKAQAAKRERLYKRFAPMKIIESTDLASPTHQPPRLVYGWAFERSWFMAYAAHNKLPVDCRPYLSGILGKDHLVYGELTKEEEENEDIMFFLKGVVHKVVKEDLEFLTSTPLLLTRPYSEKYHWVFALYSNYDATQRFDEIEDGELGHANVLTLMTNAMKEGGEGCAYDVEPMW